MQAGFVGIDYHAATARYRAHQVVELTLNGGEVVKDVGVVELEVVQNGCAWVVVHKFAAFVEESGVVLVGFNHKGCALVCSDVSL